MGTIGFLKKLPTFGILVGSGSLLFLIVLIIEDKSDLHKNHPGNQKGKFHLKLIIVSKDLNDISKIDSNKKIYKILDEEIKNYIHSIQIIIS